MRAINIRIYPNQETVHLLNRHLGSCRFLYNRLLSLSNEAYKTSKTPFSVKWANEQLSIFKNSPETEFLKETYAQVLQQSIMNLDAAFKNFFRRLKRKEKKPGSPKFKKKSRHRDSCRFTNQSVRILDENHLRLTGKLTNLKFSCSERDRKRLVSGKVVSATLKRTPSNKFFVSVTLDCVNDNDKVLKTKEPVGIDMGLKNFATLSDGKIIPNPRFKRTMERRLRLLQRSLSRKEKGSRNREKARLRLAILHERVANKRADFLHKVSSGISRNYGLVCLEDLNVKGMMKNHKLAGSISDVSWNEFTRQLSYKCDEVVKVGKFFKSSKTCNHCGHVNDGLKLSDREWRCSRCGEVLDRDFNAARNILEEGMRIKKEKNEKEDTIGRGTTEIKLVEGLPLRADQEVGRK